MAGTVVFQVGSLATPGPGIVVGQDDIGGTAWQYVKIDVGPAGVSRPASYNGGTGLPVQGIGTFQALGTFQPLAGSVHLASGTVQVLGSVQTVGTSQVLGSVGLVPLTNGGLSIYRNLDMGTTGDNPKASAGQLYGYYLYNNAAATRYLKIYNKASAPTSSDTPVITLPIPAGAAANVDISSGVAFATGIGVRATTGVADNDTGTPSANDVVVNIFYK